MTASETRYVSRMRRRLAPRVGAGLVFAVFACIIACGDSGTSSTDTPDSGLANDGSSSSDGPFADGSTSDGATGDAASTDASSRDGAAADSSTDAGTTKYDHDGPGTQTTFTSQLTNGASTFTVHVYLPGSPGAHPVVSLSPGLQQPASAYAPYAKRLASWGIVVLVRDDPGAFSPTPGETADIVYTIATWLPAENASAASPLNGKIDLARVGLSGHSRGTQATLVAAENDLKGKVKSWFGLDAVDSSTLSNGAQSRTALPAIGIPTAFIGGSVSSSCSPAADNYEVLYAVAPSPSVKITGVGAGHTQFEDPATCAVCGLCTPSGTADGAVVLAYAVRYMTAFFARELLGDATVGAAFEGAGALADVAAGRVQVTSK